MPTLPGQGRPVGFPAQPGFQGPGGPFQRRIQIPQPGQPFQGLPNGVDMRRRRTILSGQ